MWQPVDAARPPPMTATGPTLRTAALPSSPFTPDRHVI